MRKLDWEQIAPPLISIVILTALVIFGHSGLYGAHGLAAHHDAERQIALLDAEIERQRTERLALENLVTRLRRDNLDLDLLDERARRVLGYTRPDEIIIR